MAVIDWWNGPLTLVVIFFALCLLLFTIAGVACRACHSSCTFFHCDTHTHTTHTRTHARTHTRQYFTNLQKCFLLICQHTPLHCMVTDSWYFFCYSHCLHEVWVCVGHAYCDHIPQGPNHTQCNISFTFSNKTSFKYGLRPHMSFTVDVFI